MACGSASGARFVEIDGRRFWLDCRGQGTPMVLLEAGHTDSSPTWSVVQDSAATLTRVCSYDRAGRGRSSPPGEGRRDGRVVASELHALLEAAEEPPPRIMVGHSLGGGFVRIYADAYPGEIAGLVLVDAVHEQEFERIDQLLTPEQRSAGAGMKPISPEGLDLALVLRQLQSLPDTIRSVIVIARGLPLAPEEMPPDWSPAQRHEREELRQRLQADLAEQFPGGRLTIATRSGHFVHHREPGLVIDAIRALVAEWRSRSADRYSSP